MGIVFVEFKGRGIFRQGIEVHAEKIHRELTVDVMELIFIFTIILCEICLVNFFEVVKVVRTCGIDAFMDNEVFPVLFGNQGVAAMRTSQLYGREPAFIRRKSGITDFTQELSFGTVIPVEEGFGSITAWAGAGIWNVTL